MPSDVSLLLESLQLLSDKYDRYGETISLLYTQNRFVMFMAQHTLYLHYVLPRRRFESIQHMHLHWCPGDPPDRDSFGHQQWNELWRATVLYTGLKKLQIFIQTNNNWFNWEVRKPWLVDGLKNVFDTEIFELDMVEPEWEIPDLPWTLK